MYFGGFFYWLNMIDNDMFLFKKIYSLRYELSKMLIFASSYATSCQWVWLKHPFVENACNYLDHQSGVP